MWQNKKISLVFPTYNEKDSIRQAIIDFESVGLIDEIIVVNNNAKPGTTEEVLAAKSKITREVIENKQGYGFAIRRGIDESNGDYIIISEPDGTFLGKDILKLLAYSDEFDIVYGSRTAKDFIWKGANMGHFLRWGNWAVAKLMEVLFNTTNLTDVGCTMRLLKRHAAEKLQTQYTIGREHFGPEMMLLSFKNGFKSIQIPVNYTERVGISSVTGDFKKAFKLGMIMIGLILKYRVKNHGFFYTRNIKKNFENINENYLLTLIIVFHFLLFFSLVYFRYKAHTPTMDYHAYVQMLWNTINGDPLYFSQNRNSLASFFSLHFAPFLFIIAPIYKIFPHQLTLYAFFLFVTSLSIAPLFKMAKSILDNSLYAFLIILIYIFYPPFTFSFMQGFCEEAFATSLLMFTLYFSYKQKGFLYILFSFLVLSLRINMVLPVFMVGLYSFLFKKLKYEAIFTMLLSIFWLFFIIKIIQPIYTPVDQKPYIYGFFAAYGNSLSEILTSFFTKPEITWEIVSSEHKLTYIRDLFSPLMFLPILAPLTVLMSIPTMVVNILSSNSRLSTVTSYYHSSITPILFLSFIYALKNLEKIIVKLKVNKYLAPNLIVFSAIIVVLINSLFINFTNSQGKYWFFNKYFSSTDYLQNQRDKQIDIVLDSLPLDYSLGVPDIFFDKISERKWYVNNLSFTGYTPDLIIYDPWSDRDFNTQIQNTQGWKLFAEESYYQILAKDDLIKEFQLDENIDDLETQMSNISDDRNYIGLLKSDNDYLQKIDGIDIGKSVDITKDEVLKQDFIVEKENLKQIQLPIERIRYRYYGVKGMLGSYLRPPRGNLNVSIINNKGVSILNKSFLPEEISYKRDILYIEVNREDFTVGEKYSILLSLDVNDGKAYSKFNQYKTYVGYKTEEESLLENESNTKGSSKLLLNIIYGDKNKQVNHFISGSKKEIIKNLKERKNQYASYDSLVILGTERTKL